MEDLDRRFEDLYRRYAPKVYRFNRNRGCPHEEAEELTQRVLIRVFRYLPAFRGTTEASEWSWIRKIAASVLSNYWRDQKVKSKQMKLVPIPEQRPVSQELSRPRELVDPQPLAPIPLVARDKLQRVVAAIKELPPRMRQAILLRVRDELTYTKIALQMEISEETVKTTIRAARHKLREVLGSPYDEYDLDDRLGEE